MPLKTNKRRDRLCLFSWPIFHDSRKNHYLFQISQTYSMCPIDKRNVNAKIITGSFWNKADKRKSKITEKTPSNCKIFRHNLIWNNVGSKAGLQDNWPTEPWHCTKTEFHPNSIGIHIQLSGEQISSSFQRAHTYGWLEK